jgi:hypothetical protein
MKIRKFLLFTVALMGFHLGAYAQFTLDEVGFGVGGGANLLMGTPIQTGFGVHSQAYYSHYFCGKRTGFHAVIGFRYLGSPFNRSFSLAAPANLETDNSVRLGYWDIGFLGKIRRNEYHRSREAALMIGPKINLATVARYSDSLSSGSFWDVDAKASFFNVGLHASVQFRRPLGKSAWFFRPGAEYFLLPAIKQTAAGSFRNLYLFLMLEFNLFDARG